MTGTTSDGGPGREQKTLLRPGRAEGVTAGKTGDRQKWALLAGLDIGAEGDPYLDRLRLVQTPLFGIYLHHIHRPDKDPDPHDHPWSFVSVVLAGGYTETVWPDKTRRFRSADRTRGRWSARRMSRRAAHIITSCDGPLWTLVITGPRRGGWGFWEPAGGGSVQGAFVPWREYMAEHGDTR